MSAIVTIGGVNATNVNVVDSTTITATTPAHATGSTNLQVTVSGQASNILPNAFTFQVGGATVQGVYGGIGADGAPKATSVNLVGGQVQTNLGDVLAQLQTTAEQTLDIFPVSGTFTPGNSESYIYLLLTISGHTFKDHNDYAFGMDAAIPVTIGGVQMYLYVSNLPLYDSWRIRIAS